MTQILLESAARSLAMAGVAALALWVLRVRSAQVRHMVWTSVLAGALCMPFLPAMLRRVAPVDNYPVTTVISIPSAAAPSLALAVPIQDPSNLPIDPALAIYVAVSFFLLARLATGMFLTWRIAQKSAPLPGTETVRVSEELRTPVTFARTILLPANTHLWSEEMLGAVIRHEEAHCIRGDFFTQAASKVHRAVFWFNPMAWWLDRELATLAEEACDNAAVRSQEECPGYAEVLLHFATKSRLSTEAGVAMARLSSVSKRVSRLLDGRFEPGEDRLTAGRKWKVVTSMVTLILAAAVYTVTLDAQTTPPKPPSPPVQAAPSKPPTPARLPQTKKGWLWNSSNGDGTKFVLVENENAVTMSGSMDDVRRARQLQFQSPYMWFRQEGKEWLVQDRQTLDQVRSLFRPQEELGKMQAELGARQAKLGEQQAKLGEQQTGVQVEVPDLTREMQKLTERMAALAKHKADISEIGDLQAKLGELQARLGGLQGIAGGRQAELGKLQAELGAKQAELGNQQGDLGKKQAEAAAKAHAELEQLFPIWIRDGKAKPVQ